MQPAGSVQDVPRVSPAWLRPSAFALVLCLHLLLLVGIPWPAGTSNAEPPPFEIQVISPTEPARPLVPLDSAPALEVKSAKAVPVDVQAIEAQPLHGQEVSELKPPDPGLAVSSPQAVLVSPVPQVAELTPRGKPAAALVQVAEAAPWPRRHAAAGRSATAGSAAVLGAAKWQESEPLQVRPAAPAGVVQPEREAPGRPLSSSRWRNQGA